LLMMDSPFASKMDQGLFVYRAIQNIRVDIRCQGVYYRSV
jgi:hypothetical protein